MPTGTHELIPLTKKEWADAMTIAEEATDSYNDTPECLLARALFELLIETDRTKRRLSMASRRN